MSSASKLHPRKDGASQVLAPNTLTWRLESFESIPTIPTAFRALTARRGLTTPITAGHQGVAWQGRDQNSETATRVHPLGQLLANQMSQLLWRPRWLPLRPLLLR